MEVRVQDVGLIVVPAVGIGFGPGGTGNFTGVEFAAVHGVNLLRGRLDSGDFFGE